MLIFALWLSSQPGNYQSTVRRTEECFQACNFLVACFQERARVEKQYAQQLNEWSSKWKPLVDGSEYRQLCLSNVQQTKVGSLSLTPHLPSLL